MFVNEASCPNYKQRALHMRDLLVWPQALLPDFDGRCTSTILCSRSRCGAREAMTVGCKPTMPDSAGNVKFERECVARQDVLMMILIQPVVRSFAALT